VTAEFCISLPRHEEQHDFEPLKSFPQREAPLMCVCVLMCVLMFIWHQAATRAMLT